VPSSESQRRRKYLGWIVGDVMRSLNRSGSINWDDATGGTLPDTATHEIRLATGAGDVTVELKPEWFEEPRLYRDLIERAVESALSC
jgi:hypothetical protein